MDLPFYRNYELPWTSGGDQERKFRRLLGIVILVCALLGVIWPFIPVPEPGSLRGDGDSAAHRASCCWKKSRCRRHRRRRRRKSRSLERGRPGARTGCRGRTRARAELTNRNPLPEPDREAIAREQAQAALMPFAEDLADLVDNRSA